MSIDERITALERQTRRLELSNRHWRRTTLGAVLLLAFAVLAGQAAPQPTLEARGFVLRAGRGAARAQLGMNEDVPSLSLYDPGGTLRAALAVEAEGPILNLFTASGEPRLVVGERGDTAFVILRDRDGAPRAAMAVQEDGSPSIYLLDEKMNPLFRRPQ